MSHPPSSPAVHPCDAHGPRCLLCGARATLWQDTRATCSWCGAQWTHGSGDPRPALAALMTPGPVLADPERLGGYVLDDYTFRSLATAYGLAFEPADGPVIAGHTEQAARGRLHPLVNRPADVTLAVLARTADAALDALIASAAGQLAATVVVLDEGDGPERAGVTTVRLPLGRFDDSRNLAQETARTAWVLHLDTDERLPATLLAALGGLTALADAGELDAVGFARRNLVDGVLSDLWPDVQYRLVRRSVRFHGAVHERPDACRDWHRTMIARNGAIEHSLDADQVARRRARYDAMGQDDERAAEAGALLVRYVP